VSYPNGHCGGWLKGKLNWGRNVVPTTIARRLVLARRKARRMRRAGIQLIFSSPRKVDRTQKSENKTRREMRGNEQGKGLSKEGKAGLVEVR